MHPGCGVGARGTAHVCWLRRRGERDGSCILAAASGRERRFMHHGCGVGSRETVHASWLRRWGERDGSSLPAPGLARKREENEEDYIGAVGETYITHKLTLFARWRTVGWVKLTDFVLQGGFAISRTNSSSWTDKANVTAYGD